MTLASRRARRGSALSADATLDKVESVARIGSYSTDLLAGRWVSSKGLDAIFGIDAAFDRSVEGWASLIHPADREAMVAYLIDDVVGRGQPFDRQYQIVRADTGEERWVHGRGALELDGSGRPVRMVGTIADITEQAAVEEERARLEDGLRRSERNLAEAQRISHIGSWEWDLATETAQRSDELHRIYGVEPGAIPGTTEAFLAFVHPDDRARVQADERAAVTGSGQYALDYRAVRPDGSVRIVHDQAEVVRDEHGTPVRMVGTVEDITERHRAQEALIASELRYAAIFEGTAESILIADLATERLCWVNSAACALLGYTRDELLELTVHDIHPPQDLPMVLDRFRDVADGRITMARSVPCIRKDGTTLLADVKGSFVLVDGVACNVGFFTDVTERVTAESERVRLSTAVEQTSESVVITDLAGTIEYVNPAFELVSGYRHENVIGQNPRILKSGRQSTAFYRALWRRLTRGQSWTGRFFNRRVDGALYEVEATISPIRSSGGEITGYVAVERDVTALQAARSSLATEFRERAQVAAALGRLQPAGSAEETAAEICDELLGLPGVHVAVIVSFLDPQRAVPLAVRGPDGLPMAAGRPVSTARAAYLYERATQGPWAEAWRPRPMDGEYGRAIADLGIRAMAYAPIRNGEGLLGVVAAGTCDEAYARHLIDHLPVVGEFAATASAMLSGQLEGDRRFSRQRAEIAEIIASRAFHPVFQPIIALDGGEVVGHEALTRFTDGTRPDLRFAAAWTVNLGADLELATLESALARARELPAGRWLNVNVSPRLLRDPKPVRAVLAMADRPLVVEITEHETVDDYRALRDAIRSLGESIRTAVDDAGAGVANFAHIVELRPDFVKLDIGLVRGVNADLGRQAIIVAMRHFARASGCRLIAEGVETAADAATIAGLGVDFGQGYWYGRPATVDVITAEAAETSGQIAS